MIVLPVARHFTFAASLNTSQTRALRQTCRKAPRVRASSAMHKAKRRPYGTGVLTFGGP